MSEMKALPIRELSIFGQCVAEIMEEEKKGFGGEVD